MPLAGFTSFRGSKTTRKIMRVNNFAIFCDWIERSRLSRLASASAVARRVPHLRLPAPSLNLFLVALAFFIASCVAGDTRVLAATVKLGMGYDKSDIRFVIHFQLPQNLTPTTSKSAERDATVSLHTRFSCMGKRTKKSSPISSRPRKRLPTR